MRALPALTAWETWSRITSQAADSIRRPFRARSRIVACGKSKKNFKGREVSAITTGEFKRWRDSLVPADAKRRNEAPGEEYGEQVLVGAPCRVFALAYRDGKVARDDAWRRVKAFKDVGSCANSTRARAKSKR